MPTRRQGDGGRAMRSPLLIWKLPSRLGSLMRPFQPTVVRGFSKYLRGIGRQVAWEDSAARGGAMGTVRVGFIVPDSSIVDGHAHGAHAYAAKERRRRRGLQQRAADKLQGWLGCAVCVVSRTRA